ncbi:MAG: ABC transporter ATP-binding protein [Chloroflexi bacterium]|nr:MAG: ABC transporter ATP-binding protein [Chloroflexota bacterium]
MIRTENLCKRYGSFAAVDDLNLHVQPGEIYGFLGPNGAGKTTTLMMILGIIRPTSGRVEVLGQPYDGSSFALRRRMGVVAEDAWQYDEMTAYEYLAFFARLNRVEQPGPAIQSLLERTELWERRQVLVGGFSRGMRQKLNLCRALLHDPELLILDEPVSGLDPNGIRQVRELLLEENRRGRTILISSHILSEIEQTAHRVGIIAGGRLLVEDSVAGLAGRLGEGQRIEVEFQQPIADLRSQLEALPFVLEVEGRTPNRWLVTTAMGEDQRPELARFLAGQGVLVIGMRLLERSLEEAFITITDAAVRTWAEE